MVVNLLEHFPMVEFFFSEYKELKEIAGKKNEARNIILLKYRAKYHVYWPTQDI